MFFSSSFDKLIEQFSLLPGVGRKTAQRFAFYILKLSNEEVNKFADSLKNAKEKIKQCETCFNFSDENICKICSDKTRDISTICVVEEASDVIYFERTKNFFGLYHILGGVLSPLDNIGPNDLKVNELLNRINGETKEIIFAISPTLEGETTILYLCKLLRKYNIKISRIARGIPIGSDLEYVDEATIANALKERVLL